MFRVVLIVTLIGLISSQNSTTSLDNNSMSTTTDMLEIATPINTDQSSDTGVTSPDTQNTQDMSSTAAETPDMTSTTAETPDMTSTAAETPDMTTATVEIPPQSTTENTADTPTTYTVAYTAPTTPDSDGTDPQATTSDTTDAVPTSETSVSSPTTPMESTNNTSPVTLPVISSSVIDTDSMTSSPVDSMTSSPVDSMTSSSVDSMTSSPVDTMMSSSVDSTTSSSPDVVSPSRTTTEFMSTASDVTSTSEVASVPGVTSTDKPTPSSVAMATDSLSPSMTLPNPAMTTNITPSDSETIFSSSASSMDVTSSPTSVYTKMPSQTSESPSSYQTPTEMVSDADMVTPTTPISTYPTDITTTFSPSVIDITPSISTSLNIQTSQSVTEMVASTGDTSFETTPSIRMSSSIGFESSATPSQSNPTPVLQTTRQLMTTSIYSTASIDVTTSPQESMTTYSASESLRPMASSQRPSTMYISPSMSSSESISSSIIVTVPPPTKAVTTTPPTTTPTTTPVVAPILPAKVTAKIENLQVSVKGTFDINKKDEYISDFSNKLTDLYRAVTGFQRIEITDVFNGSIKCDYTVIVTLDLTKINNTRLVDELKNVITADTKFLNKTVLDFTSGAALDDVLKVVSKLSGKVTCGMSGVDVGCQYGYQCKDPGTNEVMPTCEYMCSSNAAGAPKCGTGGTCVISNGNATCSCDSKHSGDNCGTKIAFLALPVDIIIIIAVCSGVALVLLCIAIVVCVCLRWRRSAKRHADAHDIFGYDAADSSNVEFRMIPQTRDGGDMTYTDGGFYDNTGYHNEETFPPKDKVGKEPSSDIAEQPNMRSFRKTADLDKYNCKIKRPDLRPASAVYTELDQNGKK